MTIAPPRLPYGRQSIDQEDVVAVSDVLRSSFLTCGPTVERFEQAFAATTGAAEAIACSSGTAALHLAHMALELAPGDAVIVPTITFVATAHAARYCGAEVVFADVDPDSGLMTRSTLVDAVVRAWGAGLRPRAVVPVHLNGQVCAMPEIAQAAQAFGLIIIEDACHALGGDYDGENGEILSVGACRHAAMTVFSLHAVKTVTMAEGGVVTTADPRLAARLRRLRAHGVERQQDVFENTELAFAADGTPNPWYVEYHDLGFNYRASDLQCALGLSQLGKLGRFVEARRSLVQRYRQRLVETGPPLRPVDEVPHCRAGWHLAVSLIDFAAAGTERATVMRRLAAQGIGSQVHYVPVHLQPYYRRRYGALRLPGAEAYYARCLSLPLFPGMVAADVDRVVDTLAHCLRQEQLSCCGPASSFRRA